MFSDDNYQGANHPQKNNENKIDSQTMLNLILNYGSTTSTKPASSFVVTFPRM
jgi:hypothetical protein